MITITKNPHTLLDCIIFRSDFGKEINGTSPDWLINLLSIEPNHPALTQDPTLYPSEFHQMPGEDVQKAVRRLLKYGGFKPSGRSKPASEYLIKAANAGELNSINPAVDILNAVSLHAGLSIGVLDLDLLNMPLHLDIGKEGEEYVFNASGQIMSLKGLICLYDALGPCANPVKDSQRTKTSAKTQSTLTIVWGTTEIPELTQRTARWYMNLVEKFGGKSQLLDIVQKQQ